MPPVEGGDHQIMTEWWDVVLKVLAVNWGILFVASWFYVGWLWLLSGDVEFEGWMVWRNLIPVARFRLVSTKSWYARLWKKFYGMGLFLVVVHRDERGPDDDFIVERVLVHEMRHVLQFLCLGLLGWYLYLAHAVILWITDKGHPYFDNMFERDADRYAEAWMRKGRPKILTFGQRN